MGIEKNDDGFGYDISCDLCPNSERLDTDCFQEVVAEAKRKGWKSKKEDDEWINICPACQGKIGADE